jgi:prepilin-type N-terminal cleavage/methylation domain-containing protein
MTKRRGDGGYTLIELLLVIVVLATLATIVVASVGGFKADAEESGCKADGYVLQVATEAFFAQHHPSAELPEDGVGPDRYERGLVEAGFLRRTSTYYDLDADGQLHAVGPPCP